MINKLINIVLIKPNIITYDKNELLGYNYDDFYENIKNHVVIIETTHDKLMETIINNINITPEQIGNTYKCDENNNYIYQICFLGTKENNIEENNNNINSIASYLVMDRQLIYGNAILIKSRIMENNLCDPETIDNIEEVTKLLHNRLIHTCVKVNSDGTMETYKFIESPIEFIKQEEISNYNSVEFSFLNFNFLFLIQLETNEPVNKMMTRIAGTYIVNGPVIIIGKTSESDFFNVDINLIKMLDIVAWGPIKNRELNKNESRTGEFINDCGKHLVINPFNILEKRYLSIIEKINNDSNNNYVCNGCFRKKYLNIDEQKNDWNNHKYDCLYEKPNINGYLKTKYKLQQEEIIYKEEQKKRNE